MPQQFIKVKETAGSLPTTAFKAASKKPDWDSTSNLSNSTGDICRICHCEADAENPLLSPCYCSGSLKYVHQACLRQWLAASETRSCELCKFNFILHTKIKPFSEVSLKLLVFSLAIVSNTKLFKSFSALALLLNLLKMCKDQQVKL